MKSVRDLEEARLQKLLYGPYPRAAGEVMADEVASIGVRAENWGNVAGPRASQVFNAAGMREQVDP